MYEINERTEAIITGIIIIGFEIACFCAFLTIFVKV